MNFFDHQEQARKLTFRLVVAFAVSVLLVVVFINVVAALVCAAFAGPERLSFAWRLRATPDAVFWLATITTLAVILGGSLLKVIELASGGKAVAQMVGARFVRQDTQDPEERRFVNIVEEMALASGTPVPAVYVQDEEAGINAFAAGFSPAEAVIVVTRGTLTGLERDELQGVVAHEFSHILNGDMRLNIRLIGVLSGLIAIGAIGYYVMRIAGEARGRDAAPFFLLGLALLVLGWVGELCGSAIKAAISRQREYLADASAVQFTRNPDGICGALFHIGRQSGEWRIGNRHAEALSHMYFAPAIASHFGSMLATHPPLDERIDRINRNYRRDERRSEAPAAEGLPDDAAVEAAHRFASAAAPVAAMAGATPAGRGRRAADIGRAFSTAGGTDLRTDGSLAAEPDHVLSSVGAPTPRHVGFAQGVLAGLDADVRAAAGTPVGARAAIFALLIANDEVLRETQLRALTAAGEGLAAADAAALATALGSARDRIAVTIIELAMPALHLLSAPERKRFLAALRSLVDAERAASVHEFAIEIMVTRLLSPDAGRAAPIRFKSVQQLRVESAILLSVLAYAGAPDDAAAAAALRRGSTQLGGAPLELLPRSAASLPAFSAALERLRLLAPLQKAFIVRACAETALADGRMQLAEAELLRAVGIAIDCPLPPMSLAATISP